MHTKAGIQYPTDSGLTGFQLLMEYQTFQTIFLSVFLASYFAFFASLRLCVFAVKRCLWLKAI